MGWRSLRVCLVVVPLLLRKRRARADTAYDRERQKQSHKNFHAYTRVLHYT